MKKNLKPKVKKIARRLSLNLVRTSVRAGHTRVDSGIYFGGDAGMGLA